MENKPLRESASSPQVKREIMGGDVSLTPWPAQAGQVVLTSLGDMEAGPVLSAFHCFKPYFCP